MTLPLRKTARIVLLNNFDNVLLVKYEEKESVNPKRPDIKKYWVCPGGGVHDNESFEEAAIRELNEETSIEVKIDSWIWTDRKKLKHAGILKQFEQRYFLVRHDIGDIATYNKSDEPIVEARWWSITEIQESTELFFPDGLAKLLIPLIALEKIEIPIELKDND